MITGSCICGGVSFQIEGDDFEVVQCHCSRCRKVTGSTADAMIVVPGESIDWTEGTDLISIYKSSKEQSRAFCSNCGGSLPNKDGEVYWVPAGILDGEFSATVKAHIYVGSKLPWEIIGGEAPQYHEDITD